MTALMLAAISGHLEVVRVLLKRGANKNVESKASGHSLHMLLMCILDR